MTEEVLSPYQTTVQGRIWLEKVCKFWMRNLIAMKKVIWILYQGKCNLQGFKKTLSSNIRENRSDYKCVKVSLIFSVDKTFATKLLGKL